MPHYDYRCNACGHEFELFQSMTAPVQRKCPACGKLKLERLIGTGAGVIFKGGGFYETDYRSEEYRKAAEAEAKSGAGTEAQASAERPMEAGKDSAGNSRRDDAMDSSKKKKVTTPATSEKPAKPEPQPAATPATSKPPAAPAPIEATAAKPKSSLAGGGSPPTLGLPGSAGGAKGGPTWPGASVVPSKSGKALAKQAGLPMHSIGSQKGKPLTSHRSNTGRSSRGGR